MSRELYGKSLSIWEAVTIAFGNGMVKAYF